MYSTGCMDPAYMQINDNHLNLTRLNYRRREAASLLLFGDPSTGLSWHLQNLGPRRLQVIVENLDTAELLTTFPSQEEGGGLPHGGLHARRLLCGPILDGEGICFQRSNIEWD